MDAIQIMIDHAPEIARELDSKSKRAAWEALFPGGEIPFNTFKSYAVPCVRAYRAGVQQERRAGKSIIADLRDRVAELERQAASPAPLNEFPDKYRGFTMRRDKRGFIRGNRTIEGRSVAIYIGKKWSREKADQAVEKSGFAS